MKKLLSKCINGETLSSIEAEESMLQIMEGEATASQIASFLSILRYRGETKEEIIGFTKAMKKQMISLEYNDEVIDTCGTGGDGISTFNISTASALVVAATGTKVAKHGNRAVSSKSGSADVLELLGIPIQTTPIEAKTALDENHMSFLFAPLYHASMKNAVTPRKEIGFRTVFNLIGPLANPANTKKQVIGVFSTDYAERMAEALRELGSEHVLLVTGRDGIDELSISTETDIVELKDGEIKRYSIAPEDVNLKKGCLEEIQVQTPIESATLIQKIFTGDSNQSAKNIVALNAGAALYVAGTAKTLIEGVQLALQALSSGKVYDHLQTIVREKEEKYA
ncbi:anthranilate phosphoribosyltransferase [Metabacillus arenae]|uniref:Anthranilate phosphoribosyltransferase n=1 Tax=Metabacillus arenae TaxID=2771434 RepID=A0A926N7A2_9BACI|nr:anthranilate phosphoribosyltransferase [Metabacillus arenae]MBD1378607.1 anthranilate phosphoribosyltransferase [Metabacillus arenae]